MKSKLLLFLMLITGAYSCKKDSGGVNIAGKWNIVKTVQYSARDTTIIGTAGDYYNFATNGSLTIQDHYEGTLTGNYTQTSSTKVGINIYTVDGHGLGVETPPAVYTISSISSNNITITSPPYPSGQVIIYLRKN